MSDERCSLTWSQSDSVNHVAFTPFVLHFQVKWVKSLPLIMDVTCVHMFDAQKKIVEEEKHKMEGINGLEF